MSLDDLIRADAKAIHLTAGQPDVEAVRYRTRNQTPDQSIPLMALVERLPASRQEEDKGHSFAYPIEIEIAVADVATPAVGDMVELARWPGEAVQWMEVSERVRSDVGMHRLGVGR